MVINKSANYIDGMCLDCGEQRPLYRGRCYPCRKIRRHREYIDNKDKCKEWSRAWNK